MTSTTIHVALHVDRMGGSGAARMAKKGPKGGGKQKPIPCEDDSGSRGGTTGEGANPSEG